MKVNGSYTIHHRKPKSLGGDDGAHNLVKVPRSHHKAWHALFDNYRPDQILQKIQEYWILYSNDHTHEVRQIASSVLSSLIDLYSKKLSIEEVEIMKEKLLYHRRWMKRSKAWYLLFGNKDIKEVILIINTKWLDPDYELCLVGDRIALVMKR